MNQIAWASNRESGIISSAFWWVASISIGHAVPLLTASSHVRAQTHHESPGLRPGKPCAVIGVIKSFPFERAKLRKSSVTTQHTVWDPLSFESVLHFPSLYQPVIGSHEHVSSGPPSTFRLASIQPSNPLLASSLAFIHMKIKTFGRFFFL